MSRKIIIDTDPGIDDSMAIFYALNSPELEVIGLTTVFGNVTTDLCTINALRLLEIVGRSDIPVAAGAQKPTVGEFHGSGYVVHGNDGQGNTDLPSPKSNAIAQTAADFLIEQVMAHPGAVTLVTLGPLTNIARALQLEPRLADHVQEVIFMGGAAFVPGNISPAAEANIYHDPEAADLVFSAPWPMTMCGLDVTEKTIMSPAMLRQIAAIPTAEAQHLARILPFYYQFYQSIGQDEGIAVHDSTTITFLIAPHHYRAVQRTVCVDTTDGISRGKTWPGRGGTRDAGSPWGTRRPVNILVEVDAPAVLALELSRMRAKKLR